MCSMTLSNLNELVSLIVSTTLTHAQTERLGNSKIGIMLVSWGTEKVDHGHPACSLPSATQAPDCLEGDRRVEKVWEGEQSQCFFSSQSVCSEIAVYVSVKLLSCVFLPFD